MNLIQTSMKCVLYNLAGFSLRNCLRRQIFGSMHNLGSVSSHFCYWAAQGSRLVTSRLCSVGTRVQVSVAAISRKSYQFPEIHENELEETFVRGSGPGGQSVNKTANCCVLKHKPTGIIVKCHETRSLDDNRKRARQILQEKLDNFLHGENSFSALQKAEQAAKLKKKKNKSQKRLAMKRTFKGKEDD